MNKKESIFSDFFVAKVIGWLFHLLFTGLVCCLDLPCLELSESAVTSNVFVAFWEILLSSFDIKA